VAFSNQKQARWQKREDNFFSSLEWLTGKSQRRNVGIAAVEFFWSADEGPKDRMERLGGLIRSQVFGEKADAFKYQTERFKSLSIDALSNTAMYLLLESDQGFAVHESNNLRRIMQFLISVTPEEAEKHSLQYKDLNSALAQAEERRKDDFESAQEEVVEKEAQKRGTSEGDPEILQQKTRITLQKNWQKNWGLWIEPECLVAWQKDLKPLLLTDSTGRSKGTVDLAKQ
jgi:hypothetical protein